MKDPLGIDEYDLALVHALQIAPRAPWSAIGAVLGMSAVTTARRWERLAAAGLAWVMGQPGPTLWRHQCLAWVEVECESGALRHVADALVEEAQCSSIEVLAGGRDLYVTVMTEDLRALATFVTTRVDRLPGVRGTRTHIATQTFAEGSQWRLDALSAEQRTRLAAHAVAHVDGAESAVSSEVDRMLVRSLGEDGRRSATDLAASANCSAATARRRTAQLLRSRSVLLRCEVADQLVGWPVTATCWATVRPDGLQSAARVLVTLPELRLCAAVTGPANLVITVRLRAIEDLQQLEVLLARTLPQLTFIDRAVTLAYVKRVGAVLDDNGRRVGTVPVDPWAGSGSL